MASNGSSLDGGRELSLTTPLSQCRAATCDALDCDTKGPGLHALHPRRDPRGQRHARRLPVVAVAAPSALTHPTTTQSRAAGAHLRPRPLSLDNRSQRVLRGAGGAHRTCTTL